MELTKVWCLRLAFEPGIVAPVPGGWLLRFYAVFLNASELHDFTDVSANPRSPARAGWVSRAPMGEIRCWFPSRLWKSL
jgi:hypothetical protein